MGERYILDARGEPKLEPDLLAWAKWFENPDNRRVKQEYVGDWFITTVFTGLNYNLLDVGPPILWETMAFFKPSSDPRDIESWEDLRQERAMSRESALENHEQMVAWAKEHLKGS